MEISRSLNYRRSGVTVVVACYNHERFVEKCLESVFQQSRPVDRLIITDDASSDGTQDRVHRLLEERGWTASLLFHEVNRGVCATFNEALAVVETEYVAFISADDWMAPRRVEVHAGLLDLNPDACLVYGNMLLAAEDGTPTGKTYDSVWPEGWPGGDHDDLFTRLIECDWIPAPSVMSRTGRLRSVGGYDESLYYEDYDMWLKLAKAGYGFAFSPEPLVYYRNHESQMSKTRDLELFRATTNLRMYSKHLGHSPQVDAFLKPRLEVWSAVTYRDCEQPREVASLLWSTARELRSPKAQLRALLASLGVAHSQVSRLRPRRHGMLGRAFRQLTTRNP